MTVTEEATEVHQAFVERVNMLRWRAYCDTCGWDEPVTRGAEQEDGPKLSLEETAKMLLAGHKGGVYVQPGTSKPVDARELEPGDIFTVTRPLEGGNTFRFVSLAGNAETGAEWVDCWELERHNKYGWIGVRHRSFHLEEIKGRAA